MAATTAGYSFDRGPPTSSAEVTSPIYQDRPIRPLPKRRIRSRLSLEEADAIVYPPVVPSSPPSYNSPQSQNERNYADARYLREVNRVHEELEHECEHCDHGDSDEEGHYRDSLPYRPRSWHGEASQMQRYSRVRPESQYQPPPPNSSTSSADGYESFENTNNKKKRKIPLSGGLGVAPDVVGAGAPTQSVNVPYSESSRANSTGIGMSGPGRDRGRRIGRLSNERRPLASTSNNIVPYTNGIHPQEGLIGTAMANTRGPDGYAPPRGQENVSLLERQKQIKAGSQNFTFECKSDSADKLAIQPPPLPPNFPKALTVPTTTKGRSGNMQVPNGAVPSPAQYPATNRASPQQAPPPQKPRRDPDWWKRAARRRKEDKARERIYLSRPHDPEKDYFCEFCEYESIWGPLQFLGRQFEARERRRRRAHEGKKKRLNAAKAKSRKGKKGKGGTKNTNAAAPLTNAPHSQPYDPAHTDPPQDDVSPGEDFFEDEYDETVSTPLRGNHHDHHDHHHHHHHHPAGQASTHHHHHHHRGHGHGHDVGDLPGLDRSRSLPTHM